MGGRQGPPCISTAAFAQSFQGRKKERTGGTTTTTAAHGGGDSGDCMLNAAAAARRTACMRPLCSSERSSSKSCNLPEGQGPSASPDSDIFIMFCKKENLLCEWDLKYVYTYATYVNEKLTKKTNHNM